MWEAALVVMGAPPAAHGSWRLGRVIPAVLLAWVLVDTVLLLSPSAWLPLRPWLEAGRLPHPDRPFQPHVRIVSVPFAGQAADEGNLRPTEPPRAITFSTDAFGFRRNPELAPGAPIDVLATGGDSFMYGAALSDHETLPAALTRATGLNVYNDGRTDLDAKGLAQLDTLLERLPNRPRAVLYVYLEHFDLMRPSERPGLPGRVSTAYPQLEDQAKYARKWLAYWRELSPLQVLSRRIQKQLANDTILPNPHRDRVLTLTLPDGRPMVFREYEQIPAKRSRRASAVRRTSRYLAGFRDEMARRGISTHVLLMPSRYTVYAPYLSDRAARNAPEPDLSYLPRLEQALAAHGVKTTNGLTVLRQGLAAELGTGRLSFFREDNHWNPRGVEKVAQALAPALQDAMTTAGNLSAGNRLP